MAEEGAGGSATVAEEGDGGSAAAAAEEVDGVVAMDGGWEIKES